MNQQDNSLQTAEELLSASEMIDRELVELALESHARSILYPNSKVQHDRANECRSELLKRLTRVATQPAQPEYDPAIDYNRDPRCDCVHPENEHDPETGKCLFVNPTFGPCPCRGTQPAPNYPRAIELLRSLRETTDPEEIQRQKESWAQLEEALSAQPQQDVRKLAREAIKQLSEAGYFRFDDKHDDGDYRAIVERTATEIIESVFAAQPEIDPLEGPSSTEFYKWLATRPEIEYAIDHACFRKSDGYEIWRNAWLILRAAQPVDAQPVSDERLRNQAENIIESVLGDWRGSDINVHDRNALAERITDALKVAHAAAVPTVDAQLSKEAEERARKIVRAWLSSLPLGDVTGKHYADLTDRIAAELRNQNTDQNQKQGETQIG